MQILSQVPLPSPGDLEHWLIPASAFLWILGQLKKVFPPAKQNDGTFATKTELSAVSDKIDARFLALSEKIDALTARVSELASSVARLDERTMVRTTSTSSPSSPI